jgi:hypothetical protein
MVVHTMNKQGTFFVVTVLGNPWKIGKKIVKEIKEVKRKFCLDREKDLLTLVLGNDEHGGRTRGLGPSYPWWLGFVKEQETYRSRARAKKRQQEEENDKFNQLLARFNE